MVELEPNLALYLLWPEGYINAHSYVLIGMTYIQLTPIPLPGVGG